MPFAEVGAIRDIAYEFIKSIRKAGSAIDRRQLESAFKAFKQIYFFDDKTKLILKKMEEGSALSKETIEEYYMNFQESEHSVRFALETIRTFSMEQKTDLPVRLYSKLRSLADGKWNIREDVNLLFQNALEAQDYLLVEFQAHKILSAIGELNRTIEEIDDELRQRGKG